MFASVRLDDSSGRCRLFEKASCGGDVCQELSLIVFSPTGGTRKVADIVANELGDEVNVVDLADAGFDAAKCAIGELSVVAMPSFGGRAPQVAVERFGELVAPAGAKCVLVCVYGNRAYEDALVEMQDAAANCGFEVVAAVAAVAEHSIMHQFATGRPDESDRAALIESAHRISAKLDARRGARWKTFPATGPIARREACPRPACVARLQRMRVLREVAGWSHRRGRPEDRRRRCVHFLHALRGRLPAGGPKGQRRHGSPRIVENAKSVLGAQGVRALPVNCFDAREKSGCGRPSQGLRTRFSFCLTCAKMGVASC